MPIGTKFTTQEPVPGWGITPWGNENTSSLDKEFNLGRGWGSPITDYSEYLND